MKQQHFDSGHDSAEATLPSVNQYDFDIRTYLDAIFKGKYTILLIGFAVTVMTVLYLIVATPI